MNEFLQSSMGMQVSMVVKFLWLMKETRVVSLCKGFAGLMMFLCYFL